MSSSSTFAYSLAKSSYERCSCGTVEASAMPSTAERSMKLAKSAPSSSPERLRSVATRQWSRSSPPSKSPNTVCVFPTSIASSATGRAYCSAAAALHSRPVDARDERCAKNEALLREVNDRIEEVGEQLTVVPDGGQLDFRCECGRPDCEALISLTISEYEHLRSDNDRFAVTPGHE